MDDFVDYSASISPAPVTFYYCNSTWKDLSVWSCVGFPALCGHMNGQKCEKIFLKDSNELRIFNQLKSEAIFEYEKKGNKYGTNCTLKLILQPFAYNIYTIKTCQVHKGRFCGAK